MGNISQIQIYLSISNFARFGHSLMSALRFMLWSDYVSCIFRDFYLVCSFLSFLSIFHLSLLMVFVLLNVWDNLRVLCLLHILQILKDR